MIAATPVPHPWVAAGPLGPRFGVETTPLPDWAATRDFAQAVEGLGFDSLWLPDHPLMAGGAIWTSLAAIAVATRTIRLGPLVACASFWNPVILARAAADVDRISGGRLVLGLGSGNASWEYGQVGLAWPPAPERQATLEEALRIVVPLLRGQTVTYAGERYRADGAVLDPPPLQQPYVPILVAGGGEHTTLRFVAEYADASNLGAVTWAGGAFTPDDIRRKFDVLRRRCDEAGRPYDSVLRTAQLLAILSDSPTALQAKLANVPPQFLGFFGQLTVIGTPEEAVPRVRTLLEAGFQYVVFIVLPFDAETPRLLAERVIPAAVGEEVLFRLAPPAERHCLAVSPASTMAERRCLPLIGASPSEVLRAISEPQLRRTSHGASCGHESTRSPPCPAWYAAGSRHAGSG